MQGLKTRLNRLERRLMPTPEPQVHLVVLEAGESDAKVRARYERESGTQIGPNDILVMVRPVSASKS